ncbi:hypothetical protein EVAR_31708_1 [Eumeta japonica]|uniref:Uncharacterized protein n=1 Tax=Eumeta variegata TaxID=151549 RepID=A0A4C1VVS1_EUMVA|nr:hypothetical protein EVAR_31708_1 [Eumeta japonica]
MSLGASTRARSRSSDSADPVCYAIQEFAFGDDNEDMYKNTATERNEFTEVGHTHVRQEAHRPSTPSTRTLGGRFSCCRKTDTVPSVRLKKIATSLFDRPLQGKLPENMGVSARAGGGRPARGTMRVAFRFDENFRSAQFLGLCVKRRAPPAELGRRLSGPRRAAAC